jgi:tetratricopeptide (TPR) repeat protein
MSDDPKPKAGFLSGKKAAPSPVSEAEPEKPATPGPVPAASGRPGFLRKSGPQTDEAPPQSPPPVQSVQPAAAPAVAAAAARSIAAPPAPQAAPAPTASAAPADASPAAQGGDRALAEQHLHTGLDHYDRQETEQALSEYEACVKADPGFALGWNNLGMVLIDLERYDDAVASLYESIRCDPNYAEAYNNLGFVLRRMQRNIDAACSYRRFLSLEPEIEEGPRIEGWVQTVLKDNNLTELPAFKLPQPLQVPPVEPVAPAAPPAPAVPPEEPKAKIKKMAAWEVAAGNVETAAPVSAIGEVGPDPAAAPAAAAPAPNLLKPVAAAPSPGIRPASPPLVPMSASPAPFPARPVAGGSAAPNTAAPAARAGTVIDVIESGLDAFEQGELDKAAEIFKQAIQTAPENSEAHAGLGKVLVRQENFPDGIEELKLAVKFDPQDPAPYYVLGFALRAVERNVEAADAYEKFLKLAPEALDGAKMRDWVVRIKGSPSTAPASAQAPSASSAAAPATGGVPSSGSHSAEDTYVDDEQIVTETDKRYKAALIQFQEGGVDAALRECVKILNEDPGHFRTRVLLGRIYLRQKSYDNAIEQLEGALVTGPDYPEALYFLGQAAERRGSAERASVSYSRYLEVAPQGPRAERLREWLQGHVSGAGTASQMQCELCLRFFPGTDITQHEGKATCRNCLVVMGATPSSGSTLQEPVAATPTAVQDAPATGGRVKKLVIAAIFVIALGLTGFKYYNKIQAIISLITGKTPPSVKTDPGTTTAITPPPPVEPPVDVSRLRIAGDLKLEVHPYSQWSYTPVIEGADTAIDQKFYKGWTTEYILKDEPPHPQEMELKDGALIWTPKPTDFAKLKDGESFLINIAARGVWKKPDGTTKELFALSRPFTLKYQFGYAPDTEQDLGLPANEPLVLASLDVDNDGQPDLYAAWGQFRRGGLKLFMYRGANFGAGHEETSGKARNSALWSGNLEGGNDGLLAANWLTGEVTAYYIDNAQPRPGASANFGPGAVALTAARFDDPKTLHVAALLGVGRCLAIAPLGGDRKFGPVAKVQLPSNGGAGFVFPWTSADLGPGFVVVTALSDTPIQFVAYNKGAWEVKVTPAPADGNDPNSALKDRLISGAAALRGDTPASSRVAIAVSSSHDAQVVLLEEKNGKFKAVGQPLALPSPGVGLLAGEFNQSGRDDLFVVETDECRFYFGARDGAFYRGPSYKPGRMSGAAAILTYKSGGRPGVFMLNEAGKAVMLKSVEPK